MLDPQPQVVDAYERPGNRPDHCRRPPAYQVPEAKGQCREPERQKAASMTHVALRDGCLHEALALCHRLLQLRDHAAEDAPLPVGEQPVLGVRDARCLVEQELRDTARRAAGGHDEALVVRRDAPEWEDVPGVAGAHNVLSQAHRKGGDEAVDPAQPMSSEVPRVGSAQHRDISGGRDHALPHLAAFPEAVVRRVCAVNEKQPQCRAHKAVRH
mmetsp:Transcript_67846/g.188116  ORF Transcript_67846/g.188116 Transcript_67846/m.188116 type:complete len:213 (-) Transcript_67846:98-736(-)